MQHFFNNISAVMPTLPVDLLDVKLKLNATVKLNYLRIDGNFEFLDQVCKCEVIEFTDGADFNYVNLDFDWVIFYADVLKLNGSAGIRRNQWIDLSGEDGSNGADALPPSKGYGRHGLPGQPGGWGTPGRSQQIPNLFVFCQEVRWKGNAANPSDLIGKVMVDFHGYDGGEGGAAGNGGSGSNGTQGSPSRSGFLDCSSGPGWGGNGGNGGPAGVPGIGGDGTDGADIQMFVRPSQVPNAGQFGYDVKGGRGGKWGKPGRPGIPGKGGLEGQTGGRCGSAGRTGHPGGTPDICHVPDVGARGGINGPMPTIVPYTGFDELN